MNKKRLNKIKSLGLDLIGEREQINLTGLTQTDIEEIIPFLVRNFEISRKFSEWCAKKVSRNCVGLGDSGYHARIAMKHLGELKEGNEYKNNASIVKSIAKHSALSVAFGSDNMMIGTFIESGDCKELNCELKKQLEKLISCIKLGRFEE